MLINSVIRPSINIYVETLIKDILWPQKSSGDLVNTLQLSMNDLCLKGH